jgi:glycosyltransferase involved in cell wall biosynthesis
VPVVATNVGGVADVVAADTGVLVPPHDPSAFAAALERLAASTDSRRPMGNRARASVLARYDARRLAADIAALYDALLCLR